MVPEQLSPSSSEPESAGNSASMSVPTKRQRSARLTLAQAILVLEALAALFAIVAVSGLQRAGAIDVPAWFVWVAIATGVVMALASGVQKRTWGKALGWVVQIPAIAGFAITPAIGAVGLTFAVVFAIAVRLGRTIDREREIRRSGSESSDPQK